MIALSLRSHELIDIDLMRPEENIKKDRHTKSRGQPYGTTVWKWNVSKVREAWLAAVPVVFRQQASILEANDQAVRKLQRVCATDCREEQVNNMVSKTVSKPKNTFGAISAKDDDEQTSEWGVWAHDGEEGDSITVARRDGTTTRVTLGAFVRSRTWDGVTMNLHHIKRGGNGSI